MNRARLLTAKVAAIGVLFACITFAAPRGVRAEPDFKKAAMHYKDAEVAMDKKEYKIAAREYGIAYEITKDPVLFFKIAAANDAAGNCDAALIYYRRYLREGNPNAEFRAETTARIDKCSKSSGDDGGAAGTGTAGPTDPGTDTGTGAAGIRPADPVPDPGAGTTDPSAGGNATQPSDTAVGQSDETAPAGAEVGASAPSFVDEKPSWKRTAGWVSVAATVALATTGAVLGLSASSREEDLQNLLDFRDPSGQPAVFDGNTRARYDELVDEGESLDRYAKIAWIATGATAAAAVVFFALDATSPKTESENPVVGRPAWTPVVTEDGFGVAGSWHF